MNNMVYDAWDLIFCGVSGMAIGILIGNRFGYKFGMMDAADLVISGTSSPDWTKAKVDATYRFFRNMVAVLLFAMFFGTLHAQEIPRPVKKMMMQEEKLNDVCRNGPGLVPACEKRDAMLKEIEAHGWSWGHAGQTGSEKTWEKMAGYKNAFPAGLDAYPSGATFFVMHEGRPGIMTNGVFTPFESYSINTGDSVAAPEHPYHSFLDPNQMSIVDQNDCSFCYSSTQGRFDHGFASYGDYFSSQNAITTTYVSDVLFKGVGDIEKKEWARFHSEKPLTFPNLTLNAPLTLTVDTGAKCIVTYDAIGTTFSLTCSQPKVDTK